MQPTAEQIDLGARAEEATRLLKLLANEKRLRILCELANHGELSVTELSEMIGLGQSALSQHLAKMRAEGLVAFRRDAQTLFYFVANDDAGRILHLLKEIFCDPPAAKPTKTQ
ncbi:metalloregulator ArsR/SmtB family transcription factor [Breoghania sp. L-A4]|uniref:ArsR/SmtB family transcription factor n=1 Tax=Breoghania sp. L-A4 TaxID=2304600 RepID=UPI000E35B1C8|nr:metalloregulator ArsR/SmtB family transcription factor [Breoghania sp. L-A4]AXS40895.1 transcriptional regulator [Breoghania sp. L-A4]